MSEHTPELVLTGPHTPVRQLVRELSDARELIAILGRKNFFVQYRRASLGILWAVGLPLMQAVLFAVVFSRIARFDVPHYPVFVFSGMVAWTYFLSTIGPGATSIVDNTSLSSKVYFPRAVLPLSLCLGGLYSLAASLLVLLGFALILGAGIGLRIFWLVPGVVLLVLLTAGFCLALSVSHVYLRDTRYVVQAAAVVWLWVTPVIYPLSILHGPLHTLLEINPVTGVVQLFHAAFIPGVTDLFTAWVTAGWAMVLIALGFWLHGRYDRVVSDLL